MAWKPYNPANPPTPFVKRLNTHTSPEGVVIRCQRFVPQLGPNHTVQWTGYQFIQIQPKGKQAVRVKDITGNACRCLCMAIGWNPDDTTPEMDDTPLIDPTVDTTAMLKHALREGAKRDLPAPESLVEMRAEERKERIEHWREEKAMGRIPPKPRLYNAAPAPDLIQSITNTVMANLKAQGVIP